MAESVLLGLDGNDDIWECAYVDSSVTKLPYFASKVCSDSLMCVMSDMAECVAYSSVGSCKHFTVCVCAC